MFSPFPALVLKNGVLPVHDINPEDDNCNICRNIEKNATNYSVQTRKLMIL
jgi:hypothetical protein